MAIRWSKVGDEAHALSFQSETMMELASELLSARLDEDIRDSKRIFNDIKRQLNMMDLALDGLQFELELVEEE